MCDDTLETFENHAFHPTDPPQGFRNFDLGTLSKDQQRALNKMKSKQRIENEMYLNAHPEVRALISILFRHLLTIRPEKNIHEVVGSFFTRPRNELIGELLDYFNETGYSGTVVENLRRELDGLDSGSFKFNSSICTTSFSSSESSI